MTPVEIVQHQLDAYNRHDLEAFVAVYADDIRIHRMPATEPSLVGKEQLAKFYAAERFSMPQLRAELLNRMALGNKVVDHERIHGLRDAPFDTVAVYAIASGKIASAWFFMPD